MNKVQQCVYCEENNKNAEVCGRLLRAVPLRRGRVVRCREHPPPNKRGNCKPINPKTSAKIYSPKGTAPRASGGRHGGRWDSKRLGSRGISGCAITPHRSPAKLSGRVTRWRPARVILPAPAAEPDANAGSSAVGGALPSLPDLLSRRNRCGFSGRLRGGDSCSICAWDLVFHVTCT